MSRATSCSNTHEMLALSAFSTGTSIALFLATVPLNALLLYAMCKNNGKILGKSFFYKLLFNIGVADLLIGLFSDPISVMFHLKETITEEITRTDVLLVHLGLFVLNNVSVLTMTLLCADRMCAILRPFVYQRGVDNRVTAVVMPVIWSLALLCTLPYFQMGYVKYLTVFSFGTVSLTCLVLIATVFVYRQNYFTDLPQRKASSAHEESTTNGASSEMSSSQTETRPRRSSVMEQRVNKSFFIMLLVFILTYIPSCFMTVYMNLCTDCNCAFIHILRDYTYLSILSSACWRALNFMVRLNTINRQVKKTLGLKIPSY